MNTADKALAAAITAVILAMEERKTNIVVKPIKRTSNNAYNWAFADRRKNAW